MNDPRFTIESTAPRIELDTHIDDVHGTCVTIEMTDPINIVTVQLTADQARELAEKLEELADECENA